MKNLNHSGSASEDQTYDIENDTRYIASVKETALCVLCNVSALR